MPTTFRFFAAAPLVAAMLAAPVSADEPSNAASVAAPADPDPRTDVNDHAAPGWTLQLEPSIWYVSPSGKLRLPVSSGTGPGGFTTPGDDVEIDRLNLDTPRVRPYGEAHLSVERLRFTFSGSDYSVSHDPTTADGDFRLGSVVVNRGDALDLEFSLTTVELTGGYQVWWKDFAAGSTRPDEATPVDARLYLIGGARFYDLSIDLANRGTGAAAGADEFFVEPLLGARLEFELAERFTIDVQSSVGYSGDVFSVDVAAGFVWRPHPNVGIQVGYRQLAYWLSEGEGADEFEYTGRLAGLFTGLTIRF